MPITASPSGATLDLSNTWQKTGVVFAIPAGVYTAAQFDADLINNGLASSNLVVIDVAKAQTATLGGNGHYTWDGAALLSKINAAAGGNWTVICQIESFGSYPPGAAGPSDSLDYSNLTLSLSSGSANPTPPDAGDIIASWQPKRFDILLPRRLNPSILAVPVIPVNTNASSIPVRILFSQNQPGIVTLANLVSSAPVRMVFRGGGGSVLNVPNLFTSSRPVRMAFTSAAAGATTVLQAGTLKFSMCRDNRGASWTAERTIATGVDANSCGVAWLGNRWGCLYTVGGQAYWKTATDPDDWSAAPSTVTGITGRVYGLARNQMGILCALVDNKPVVSRNGGLTWIASAAAAVGLPASICAKNHYFVIVSPSGTAVRHLVSKDGGATFV